MAYMRVSHQYYISTGAPVTKYPGLLVQTCSFALPR